MINKTLLVFLLSPCFNFLILVEIAKKKSRKKNLNRITWIITRANIKLQILCMSTQLLFLFSFETVFAKLFTITMTSLRLQWSNFYMLYYVALQHTAYLNVGIIYTNKVFSYVLEYDMQFLKKEDFH